MFYFHMQSTNVDVTAGFASTLAMRVPGIFKQRYALGTIHHVVPQPRSNLAG